VDEDEYNIDADLMLDMSQGAYGLQPYQQQLGKFQMEAPGLIQKSAEQQRRALAQSQRTGLASLAEGAAQARAAAMGGAGQMAGGGGRAASMRQGGLSFGKRAADYAAEGAMRAAGLEKGLLGQQLQLSGELLPGAMLAQSEAQRSMQNDLVNMQEYIEILNDNYSASERPGQLRLKLSTIPAGSSAHRAGMMELVRLEQAAERARALAEQRMRMQSGPRTLDIFGPRPGEPGYVYVDPYA
tara:strand:+ start:2868 stop:3590 length:723 start_codon:yes stop_codon:yes gene_type:complete